MPHQDKKSFVGQYQAGLNSYKESVISAHFMNQFMQDKNLSLYTSDMFDKRSIKISTKDFEEALMPIITRVSREFIASRVGVIKQRAKKNFALYNLQNSDEVGVSQTIAEVMFDRQFLKGLKVNCSRILLANQIERLTDKQIDIKMVIPALPYKVTSPVKCKSEDPDLGEVIYLIRLAEIAQIIDNIYHAFVPNLLGEKASFTVVSDGLRFNQIVNEPSDVVQRYQERLKTWIMKLKLSSYVKIVDYREVIQHRLPDPLKKKKEAIKKASLKRYHTQMWDVFDVAAMKESMKKAIAIDPDTESSHIEKRFIPLFKSLLYTVKFQLLTNYSMHFNKNYHQLYLDILREPFELGLKISLDKAKEIEQHLQGLPCKTVPSEAQIFEVLRRSILREAWQAAIEYICEIKSDRELDEEPISTCFPDHVRWTIHAKQGQLALLVPSAIEHTVQPWHGVAVFKYSKNSKVKLYSLPTLYLEGIYARPVVLSCNPRVPLFYIHPDLKINTFEDFVKILEVNFSLQRKS